MIKLFLPNFSSRYLFCYFNKFTLLALLFFVIVNYAFPQSVDGKTQTENIEERIKLVREKKLKYDSEINFLIDQSPKQNNVESHNSLNKIPLIRSISSLLSQQIAVLQNISELQSKTLPQVDDHSPLVNKKNDGDFFILEQLRNDYLRTLDKARAAKDLVGVSITALDAAVAKFEAREKKRRLVKEQIVGEKDSAELLKLEQELKENETSSIVAEELKNLRELELRFSKLNRDAVKSYAEQIETQLAQLKSKVTFLESDYNKVIEKIDGDEQKATDKLLTAEAELGKAQKEYQKQKSNEKNTDLLVQEDLRSLLGISQLKQQIVGLTRDSLDRLRFQRDLWEKRRASLQGMANREEQSRWKKELEAHLEGQRFTEKELSKGLLKTQKDILALTADMPFYSVYRKTAEELVNTYQDSLKSVEQISFFLKNFQSELVDLLPAFDWVKYYTDVSEVVAKIWSYEIFTTSDDRPITVSKVVIGLLLLFSGYFLSRYLSIVFVKRILNKLKLDEGAVAAIQTILFYLLIIAFTLFALHVANVPLTVFTVLGGALAIGVGFGSQNVVNNFISGLILLTERPIKVGDLLDIDATYGRVMNIGARSTIIRTSANIDIIVPNSSFLEKNVINWTRNDTNVRLNVTVGVIYGSPTALVKELLITAVKKCNRVIKQKEIIVVFLDFGDNALIFEVHFWAQVRSNMDRKILESEVRFNIDELFRENNLVIAFPQRDVHLDTLKPLEIKLVNDSHEKA